MKIPKELVVKDNTLNQYTFYKSSTQLKIFAQIICDIRKAPDEQIYTLEIKNIIDKFKSSKKNYEHLKNICRNMMQVVEIPRDRGFEFSSLFYNIKTSEQGLVNFEVNPNLKPYLLNISNNFTSYHLDKIVNLKSSYSIRMYELLKQYQDDTWGWWWKVTIEKLKETLKIETDKYQKYSHFKNKIILWTQKELEEKTDIKFQFEEQKKGRRVEVITFYILPNKKIINQEKSTTKKVPKEPQKIVPKITKNESYKILSEQLKIDKSFIKEIYQNYDEKRILENAKHTLKEFKKGSIKSSIGGFLRESLKHNFANQKSLLTLQEEQKEMKKREELEKQKLQKAEEKRVKKLQQDFQKNITQKVEKYISENEHNLDNYYEKFKERFAFALGSENDIKKAIKENQMTKLFFINFLSKKVLDKKELDFEEFKKNLHFSTKS